MKYRTRSLKIKNLEKNTLATDSEADQDRFIGKPNLELPMILAMKLSWSNSVTFFRDFDFL